MLIIPCRKNEGFVIGDSIIVTVIEIRGDKVRLGIDTRRKCPFTEKKCTTRFTQRQCIANPYD